MRPATALITALLVGCSTPRPPPARAEAPPATPPAAPLLTVPGDDGVPFAGGVRAERPTVRVRTGDARGEMGFSAEEALGAVLDVQEQQDATPESQARAWCALAAVRENNPHQARAEEACTGWRGYIVALAALREAVADDTRMLLGYMRLDSRTRADKLRAVHGFLGTYAPLAHTPHGKVGLAVREALLTGRLADLEAGLVSRREGRSGLTRIWQEQPPAVENAPPAHAGFWVDAEDVTVGAYRACLRDGACGSPGTGAGCTWTSEPRPTDGLTVTCVAREQAEAFCAWTGGRLPTLLEWRSAALPEEGFARLPARGFRCVE